MTGTVRQKGTRSGGAATLAVGQGPQRLPWGDMNREQSEGREADP